MAAGPALPYANNLTFDDTLSFSDDNYREKLENGTELERRSKEERMASVIEYPEPRVFARFAFAAYQDWKKEGESQSDYEKRLQLPEGWKLLTSARGLALKGAIYGYFGSAFWQPEHRRVVIAHRGTIPTNLNAIWADVVGILGHSYVKQMSAACTFADKIRDAVETVERERQSSFEIFFTGHSLGAWLAQVTTFSLKYLTLVEGAFVKNVLDDGYHARTVVFDSPGCEETIRKMIKDLDVRYAGKSTSAASLDVTTYLSSPNFVNCCNRHIGKLYRLYPQIDSEGYVKYTLTSHSMKGVLEKFVLQARPKLKEVVDWPQIQIDLWQLKAWKLPDKILGKEYEDFFQFAKDLNDYDPSTEKIRVEFESATTDNDNAVRFVRVRYQTKPARTDECASNVFTDSELQFLQRFQQLKIIPNSLFEGEEIAEKNRSQIAEYLNNLVINAKDNTISLREEGQLKIFKLVPFVKTLLRLYPRLKERARHALTDFEVRKQIYADITKEYRRKMEYLTTVLNQSGWPELDPFLDNESSICHVLAECGTDSAMAKFLRAIETKDLTVLAFELQNLVTTETFIHLTEFLKSEPPIDDLFLIAIECKAGTFRNRENSRLVKKVLEEMENGRSNAKLIIITDKEDDFNLDDDWVRLSHGGITWVELTNLARAETMSKKLITFQGNSEKIGLKNFTSNLSDLPEILDPKTLEKFLKGEDVLVGHKIPALADFYVPRKFKYNPYVKEEIFENAKDADVVAVLANDHRSLSTIATRLEDHWKKRRFQIITSDENFKFLCEENSEKKLKNIHCLTLESNLLVWRKTKGSLNLIRKHIRDSAPGTVLESIEDVASKTLIISDAPGMGKSTVLSVLAQKIKERTPKKWVIRVNLNDCAKALYDAKNNYTRLNNLLDTAKFLSGQILNCSENTDLKSEFERKLFEKSLTSSGGMVLILDAFDEISPDYEEIVLQLVKLLNESCLEKLVLSTRPHTKEQLEDQLATLSYTMVPFSRDDQKQFLKQFWMKRLNEKDGGQIDSDDLANQCVDHLEKSISTEGDFLGIPLQCELLAEYTLDKIVNGKNQPELKKISSMELYETFVRKKMDIYQEEKNSKTEGEIGARMGKQLMGSEIQKAHRQYALRLLLAGEKWDELDYPEIEENPELIDIAVRKAGLMLKTGDNPQFVHRTFAEFFVFDYILYLARNTTKKASLKLSILSREVLLQPEFGVARTFLDGLIRDEKNVEETTAILKRFVQIVNQNWTDNKTICLSRQGYTVLHQLLLGKNFNVLDALLKIVNEICGPDIVKYLIDTPEPRSVFPLHIAIEISHLEIVRLFLEKGANIDACMNNDTTPLFVASYNGHLEIVRLLLEKGANINACTKDDTTPLYVASQNGHLEIAHLLLEKGANISACTKDGSTPFYIASQNGHLEIARLLLKKGANINASMNDDTTPFYIASQNGHLEIARLLLENGANINARMNDDSTSLYVASYNGHLEIVRLLLENGANINYPCMNDDTTPLFVASYNGHLEITGLLLEKGANINACMNDGSTSLYVASYNGHLKIARLLLEKRANIDACRNNGSTPFFIASQNGHLEIARLLLEKGAKIDACRNDGTTPLLVASQNGHLETTRLLLKKGANIDACRNDGMTPLFVASQNGHLKIARLLLEKGANIDACRNDGTTPLYVASQNDHLEIARLLLENGAYINACMNDDSTPLYVASYNGHLEIAHLLLEKGANINACMNDDATPLYVASFNGHLEIARLLLEKGADINAGMTDDATPLYVASYNGHLEIVRLLLEKGANIDSCRNNGSTPLYVASQNGHLEIVRLLLENGANINYACMNDDTTPLFVASQNDHLKIARLLLEKGANIDACRIDGTTPLSVASYYGHLEIFRLLLEMGANMHARKVDGWTSLHAASFRGHLKIVKLLIEAGAKVDLQDYAGKTALHVASYNGQLGVAELLVQNGHSVNVAEFLGTTPLHSAAGEGQLDLVVFLLENGANMDAVTVNSPPVGRKETPLHHAALEGWTDTVRLLVQRGADVLATNSHDQTPLDLAIIHSHTEIIPILSSSRQKKRPREK